MPTRHNTTYSMPYASYLLSIYSIRPIPSNWMRCPAPESGLVHLDQLIEPALSITSGSLRHLQLAPLRLVKLSPFTASKCSCQIT